MRNGHDRSHRALPLGNRPTEAQMEIRQNLMVACVTEMDRSLERQLVPRHSYRRAEFSICRLSNILAKIIERIERKTDMVPLALLKQERRARDWTQDDLALRAGITVPTLRGLEAGRGTLRSLVSVMTILDLAWGWAGPDENAATTLATRRREKALTQAELANRAHCSRPTIIALERELAGSVSILLSVLAILGLRQSLRSKVSKTSGGLVPPRNAPARDIVMTPPQLAAAILAHFEDRLAGSILDPARARGAFFDRFPDRLERHWCELAEGRDFLNWKQPVCWIITNPP